MTSQLRVLEAKSRRLCDATHIWGVTRSLAGRPLLLWRVSGFSNRVMAATPNPPRNGLAAQSLFRFKYRNPESRRRVARFQALCERTGVAGFEPSGDIPGLRRFAPFRAVTPRVRISGPLGSSRPFVAQAGVAGFEPAIERLGTSRPVH